MPYKAIKTTLIPNTTMKKFINNNGEHTQYNITPKKGYVLHDNRLDEPVFDPETLMNTDKIKLGYYEGTRSVSVNYDFNNVVEGTDGNTTVEKIGEYELYAIKKEG